MSDAQDIKSKRPLSPHLQIYKPQLTSGLSILHRATGVALAIGTLMVVWLLVAAASGQGAYEQFMSFTASPLGMVMMLGWSFSLFYHMLNGMRHLVWDTGRLFNVDCAKKAGLMILLASILLTGATWYCAFNY
ncbi:MAG: succinate dehydrogenase, cytochrome b556 subunit [Micavibrio sp.]|nr:succinate dehydrogenase, cytochrome b556 subunit [Micavibrio sp.]